MIEGRNDSENRRPAPRGRTGNDVRRRNIHLGGFRSGNNDPSSRFNNIVEGYQALDGLTHAISQFIAAPLQGPPRRMIDIVREYNETSQMLENASNEQNQTFY